MKDALETKKAALELRKKGQYSEALNLYRELWSNHREVCNEWDGWGFASCLRKLGDSYKALEICRNVYQTHPDFDNCKNLYAWCIYDTEIKKNDDQIKKEAQIFFKAANAILDLTVQNQYSPYTKTVFRVIDYISKTSPSYPANNIIKWLDKLDPKSLSKEPFPFIDKDKKHREIQSDQEKWFATKTKALEKNEAYEECIDLCKEALLNISKFHYSNDIWFKRRIALSKAHLGDKRKAADELEVLLQNKKEWFIQHELARIHYDLGNIEKALKFAIEAALNFGKNEYKWELFVLMAQILNKQGQVDYAKKHLLFAAKLRMEHEWEITDSLSNMIHEFNVDLSESTDSRQELLKDLKIFWETEKFSGLPSIQGFIKIVLSNGKAGFISGNDRKDYYFKINAFKGNRNIIREGLKVTFNIEDSFDKKKKVKTKAATNVRKMI